MTTMATMDRRTLMAAFAALAVPGSAFAKAVATGDLTNVKAMMDKYVGGKILPGMVYGVRRLGEPPAYLSSEGTLDFDTPIKCAPDSLFRVYSMTKPTIGAAAMQLIEEGKLKLDTPLADILPEFKNMRVLTTPAGPGTETRPATKPILIRHILTHTAGFSYVSRSAYAPLAQAYIKNGIVPGQARDRDKAPGADQALVTNWWIDLRRAAVEDAAEPRARHGLGIRRRHRPDGLHHPGGVEDAA